MADLKATPTTAGHRWTCGSPKSCLPFLPPVCPHKRLWRLWLPVRSHSHDDGSKTRGLEFFHFIGSLQTELGHREEEVMIDRVTSNTAALMLLTFTSHPLHGARPHKQTGLTRNGYNLNSMFA